MFATDIPKPSTSASSGPFVVEALISTVLSTEPSVFINIMCTAPRALPPLALPFSSISSPCVPTAMSLTPSPFKSPMFATDIPK